MSHKFETYITAKGGRAREIIRRERVDGWGEGVSRAKVAGRPLEIRIDRNGKAQFGIRVTEDGGLIITDYGSLCWETFVPQNIRFMPGRNRGWKRRRE